MQCKCCIHLRDEEKNKTEFANEVLKSQQLEILAFGLWKKIKAGTKTKYK